jgi:JAB domain-containing protein similar to deubiquitination enzymes
MFAALFLAAALNGSASQCFAAVLKEGGYGFRNEERAAFLVARADGSYDCAMWPRTNGVERTQWDGVIPPGTVAIAHTHPRAKPLPSQQDMRESKRLGMPIYVVTPSGVTVAEP